MNDVIVSLTDENAYGNYPFLYNVGQRVRLRSNGRERIVINATFTGADHPGGAFEIIYDVRLDDGRQSRIPMVELESADANSTAAKRA
jgi:hypothetical protein